MSISPPNERPGPITEVTFSIGGSEYPFVGVSKAESCTFELAKMLPRREGRYAEFFNVTNVDPARLLDLADDHERVDVTLLSEYDRGGLFEFTVSRSCPAVTLAEIGALPREVYSDDGDGYIVAEIPPQHDPPTVIEAFLEEISGAELARKRETDSITPIFTRSALQEVLDSTLTDRQFELLRAAFEAGYYDWPRKCTGEELAAEFDIASATFSEHIHAAERKLLTVLFHGQKSTCSDRS